MSGRRLDIGQVMADSGVKFGTSGARGTVDAMTDEVCYAYTSAFLQHLEKSGQLKFPTLAVGGDLRPSTPRIMEAVAMAGRDRGYRIINCGFVPSPALALYGLEKDLPAVMVTGSHIPDDRNGLKFNKPTGEILKADEIAIRGQTVSIPENRFGKEGAPRSKLGLPEVDSTAFERYVERYLRFFPAGCLTGLRVGVYEHSSVARETLTAVLSGLGAEVIGLGRSDIFIPVDTEAIRTKDIELARHWSSEYELDSIVSTDGDGDRPMVSDEMGRWLRGDITGILCARYLRADTVVTPISSNTAVEMTGEFTEVVRTRIGSPFVIEAMESACAQGAKCVVGYEANGGFLTATSIEIEGRALAPLPTRDATIVPVIVLLSARESGGVSRLLSTLPGRYTASDRVKAFPVEWARHKLEELKPNPTANLRRFEEVFGFCGFPIASDSTDGLRVTYENGEIIHLRPSGNAPEIRCYVESASEDRSADLLARCMQRMESWKTELVN